jgi:hypothetical protein
MNKVGFGERDAIYAEAIKTFGVQTQLVVAVEELSELQKEVCKAMRFGPVKEALAEEIADATIMLEQLRRIFDLNFEVCSIMDEKVKRLQERVEVARRKKKALTNGQWLRAMPDEELAEMLYLGGELGYCSNKPKCGALLDSLEGIPEENCKACLVEWLKKEREGSAND